ncbi:5'-nucleotidase C-terminal domain-containing protein [Radiobacillus kanasensis]|uniref:bifunctional metallophosphatase/5'-nucleotidase n=1 Tax=Radiobacillus kanasensis TaxID=2844358 RepID=UPI001E603339|nr:5'-nucleotidase C-terminal domain-containing protein [Radiobacillus kanasensis]UFU01209.1 5'-nucleotidase C-terminal domain-containing protein [Radiobacillus kanasensis]
MGINDFHGQIDQYRTVGGREVGGAEYLAAYLKKYEKTNKNTLLVHAGDAVGASSPTSALLQDEPTIEILNTLGFDVGTLGNHEFDEGLEELKRLMNGGYHETTGQFEGANFPYVVANVVHEDTGKPILPPYIVKRVNGMKIGFIGVVTQETEQIVVPSGIEGLAFTDETEAINKSVKDLKKRGVESIVVLAHNPASSDFAGGNPTGEAVEMANTVDDEVDIIFGGHNHAYANTVVDNKLIVQSYSYGTAFSDVDIVIDPKTKDIVKKSASIVTTYHDQIKPDEKIAEMVDKYVQEVAPLINQVVGEAAEPITENTDESGESALGNLVADSQREEMGTDFAFMNPGGIRADLDAGPITWGELFTIQPFGNTLMKMTLTGDQVKEVLEQQFTENGQTILQVSGLSFTWDKNAAIGNKVVSLTTADGTPIEGSKSYTVTVNNFLATGGDGFTAFKQGTNQTVGPVDLDAIVSYIESQGSSIQAPPTNRINVVE